MSKFAKGTFVLVPNKEKALSLRGASLSVYVALCAYADEDGGCFPSYNKLAKDTYYTVRACKEAIENLIDNNLITKEQRVRDNGSQASNYYQIQLLVDDTDEGGVNHSSRGGEPQFTPLTQPYNSNKKIEKKDSGSSFGAETLGPKSTAAARALLPRLIEIVNPKEKPTADRISKLNGRLKDYTEEEILGAARALSQSKWHRENGQMSIDNLLAPSKFGRWYAQRTDQAGSGDAYGYRNGKKIVTEDDDENQYWGGELITPQNQVRIAKEIEEQRNQQ